MEVRVHAFPSRDSVFVEFVQVAWRSLPEPRTPETLQRAIRQRYPAAVVTRQAELARHGEGPFIWYAFRTAALGLPEAGSSPADAADSPAWAILDDERRFVDLSAALAEIAELPAGTMLGQRVEAFSNPADPTVRDDIARLWDEFRAAGDLSSTLRFNYADGRPREVAYRLVADADGPGRHRLIVHVIEPEA